MENNEGSSSFNNIGKQPPFNLRQALKLSYPESFPFTNFSRTQDSSMPKSERNSSI